MITKNNYEAMMNVDDGSMISLVGLSGNLSLPTRY